MKVQVEYYWTFLARSARTIHPGNIMEYTLVMGKVFLWDIVSLSMAIDVPGSLR